MSDKTLWRNKEAKFKPRNLQAALICRKAHEIFMPPPEPMQERPKPPTPQETERRIVEIKLSIQKQKEQEKEKIRQQKILGAQARKERRRIAVPSNRWVGTWERKLAKMEGRPKPTKVEIAIKKQIVDRRIPCQPITNQSISIAPLVNRKRLKLYLLFRGDCFFCGNHFEIENTNSDHLVPKSKGGREAFFNKVLSCKDCNIAKKDRMPTQTELEKCRRIHTGKL